MAWDPASISPQRTPSFHFMMCPSAVHDDAILMA
jgi:hypothetical protein